MPYKDANKFKGNDIFMHKNLKHYPFKVLHNLTPPANGMNNDIPPIFPKNIVPIVSCNEWCACDGGYWGGCSSFADFEEGPKILHMF